MSSTPVRPCTTTALLWQNSLWWISTPSATCFSTGPRPFLRRAVTQVDGTGAEPVLLRQGQIQAALGRPGPGAGPGAAPDAAPGGAYFLLRAQKSLRVCAALAPARLGRGNLGSGRGGRRQRGGQRGDGRRRPRR